MSDFNPQDIIDLRRAVEQLEAPGFFIKVVNWVGKPVEYGIEKLPKKAQEIIGDATKRGATLAARHRY